MSDYEHAVALLVDGYGKALSRIASLEALVGFLITEHHQANPLNLERYLLAVQGLRDQMGDAADPDEAYMLDHQIAVLEQAMSIG